ncbi:MAG: MBL fold metallo-hydrolase [Acidobacteriota bacterium]
MAVELERFYLGCLAHASYMVGSGGEAAVIDPQRDIDQYLERAAERGWQIRHVIETHLHADFVSGHGELAERTGARIYFGAAANALLDHVAVHDGDQIRFGDCRLRFLETPGHTLESVCVLMEDLSAPGQPMVLFSGDTLFAGDVGRPDLSPTHTPEQLAAILYDSLHQKLMPLPDDTVIYPAHGAGSLCGRQLGPESWSTLGRQKQTNYALRAGSREDFVHLLTAEMPPRPEYFARDVDLNRRGATALAELKELEALSPAQVRERQQAGALVVDTRPAIEFAAAHVPGSIHIGLSGQYASWAARILGLDRELILCCEDDGHLHESRLRLARVGVENVHGYLRDGLAGWVRDGGHLEYIPQISAAEVRELLGKEPVCILDVRETSEFEAGHIAGALSLPLGELESRLGELPRDRLLIVHCKGGYRSSIATSLLRRAGLADLANLTGGYDAWKATGA